MKTTERVNPNSGKVASCRIRNLSATLDALRENKLLRRSSQVAVALAEYQGQVFAAELRGHLPFSIVLGCIRTTCMQGRQKLKPEHDNLLLILSESQCRYESTTEQ